MAEELCSAVVVSDCGKAWRAAGQKHGWLLLLLVAIAPPGAFAAAAPQLVSARSPELPDVGRSTGDSWTIWGSSSADGRWIAFESEASDLIASDDNGASDVFLRDMELGQTTLVSVNHLGAGPANSSSSIGAISADGSFVVFTSHAQDLVAEPHSYPAGVPQVYGRDLRAGTTQLLIKTLSGGLPSAQSTIRAVSADARWVLFENASSDLVPSDGNGRTDVFLYDREADSVLLVSATPSGASGNHISSGSSMSSSGRYVAFESVATDLLVGVESSFRRIYLRDVEGGTTKLVSKTVSGDAAVNGSSFSPKISPSGHAVAFESSATNLVGADTNGAADVFLYGSASDAVDLVSRRPDGTPATGSSSVSAVSGNGRRVVFTSFASDLSSADSDDARDVFVYDAQTMAVEIVSVDPGGLSDAPFHEAGTPNLSLDGRLVTFGSTEPLVSGVTSWGANQVYARYLPGGPTVLLSHDPTGTTAGNDGSHGPILSRDAATVSFYSAASNLVAQDTNGFDDLFASDLGCRYSRLLPADTWLMVAIPCQPAVGSEAVTDLFAGQLVAAEYGSRWILYDWLEDQGRYQVMAANAPAVQGQGYWIKTLDEKVVTVAAGDTPSTCPPGSTLSECFEIPLVGGAGATPNLLGHPFATAIPWGEVRFHDQAGNEYTPSAAELAGIAGKDFWMWNGSAYQIFDDVTPSRLGSLVALQGVWVKVASTEASTLRIPTVGGTASASAAAPAAAKVASGGSPSAQEHRRHPQDEREWYVELSVTSDDGHSDPGNVFGQLNDSVAGYDWHDLAEPAPFGSDWLTIVFPHPEWGLDHQSFTSDFRQAGGSNRERWLLEVHSSKPGRTATIRWSGEPGVLEKLHLRDADVGRNRAPIRMDKQRKLTFQMSGTVKAFEITARGGISGR